MPPFAIPRSLLAAACALSAATAAAVCLTAAPTPASAAVRSAIGFPAFTIDPPNRRSPATCAVSVTSVAGGVGTGNDDTAAFTAAMQTALTSAPRCYPAGPSGAPQAVVYVPPGTYEIANLSFPSNVRLEVDALAVLQEPSNRPDPGVRLSIPMISWDNPEVGGAPVTNVSIVGVGRAWTTAKRSAAAAGRAAIRPFALDTYFTMNLDPATTNSTNYQPGIEMQNVRHFLVDNVFAVQNDTLAPKADVIPWPSSARTVLEIHAPKTSPLGGPFVQPTDGTVSDMATIGSPRGFGPTQINAATRLTLQDIYSAGGTTLRIETDGSLLSGGGMDRGATVDQLTARNIVGVNCNRAVALSPHDQINGSVDVSGVWSFSCWQGVTAQEDNKVPVYLRGSFASAVVGDVHVQAGPNAQLPSVGMLWAWGQSSSDYYIDPGVTWNPQIDVVASAGTYTGIILPEGAKP